jgi:hypothetical protein
MRMSFVAAALALLHRRLRHSKEGNRRYRRPSVLVAGLLLTTSACVYGIGVATDTRRAHDADGAVRLNVTNHNNGPMEVYAAGSGSSYRMGTVYPGFTSHFVVRPGMIINGPVEFLARFDDRSPLVRSGRFLLAPGNVVDFELAITPVNSIATVRPSVPQLPSIAARRIRSLSVARDRPLTGSPR